MVRPSIDLDLTRKLIISTFSGSFTIPIFKTMLLCFAIFWMLFQSILVERSFWAKELFLSQIIWYLIFCIFWQPCLSHFLSCTYCSGFNTFSIVWFWHQTYFPPYKHCSNHSNIINFGQTNFPNLTSHIFQSLQWQNISKQEIQNEVFFIFKPFIFYFWLETASCIRKKPNKKGTNIKYQYPILAHPKSFWSIYHKTSANLTQNWILMTDYAPGFL